MNATATSPADIDQMCRDYARIECAIEYLEAQYQDQPELDDVARAVGLSQFHFQRLFRRWAGVSPKRFVQFLTLDHARRQLAESVPVLDAALSAGLSGPSRLHDLFVTYEAMTPGAYRRAGDGIAITWGVGPSPFGPAYAAMTPRGLCALGFLNGGPAVAAAEIQARWPRAALARDDSTVAPLIAQAFATEAGAPPLHLFGTNFQLKVWEALLRVPPGAVVSYDGLAGVVCTPRAARAVAGALARNPVGWLIPCHRVIRKSGRFSDYAWGHVRKRAMVAREAALAGQGLEGRISA